MPENPFSPVGRVDHPRRRGILLHQTGPISLGYALFLSTPLVNRDLHVLSTLFLTRSLFLVPVFSLLGRLTVIPTNRKSISSWIHETLEIEKAHFSSENRQKRSKKLIFGPFGQLTPLSPAFGHPGSPDPAPDPGAGPRLGAGPGSCQAPGPPLGSPGPCQDPARTPKIAQNPGCPYRPLISYKIGGMPTKTPGP